MNALRLIVLLLATGSLCQSSAQSRAGITGIRDTSYTIANEYNKHRKNYPGLQVVTVLPDHLVKEEKNSTYCSTKERELKLDVFYPAEKARAKRTAILFVHGGGWRSGDKEMHHPLAQELASRGYVCVTPEYRLSTEALFPAAVHDIKSAVRWLRKNAARYDIDPERIVVAGHSAGGELAAFTGATNGIKTWEGKGCYPEISSKVNAVIDLDGTLAFIHPESGEGDDSKKTSAATYWFGYSKTENPELWKQAAPLTHAGKHCPPFLFLNSGVARMHAGRDDFIRVLATSSIYTEIRTLENAPHTFLFFQPWFDSTLAYIDRFLRRIFLERHQNPGKLIRVAKDGSGDFTTVQAALQSIPAGNKVPVTVFVHQGIYREKVLLDSTRPYITLVGEDNMNTVITYDDHTGKITPGGDTISTRSSWTFKIQAPYFTARDICFRNDAGLSAGQAVAVESDGDKAVFLHCRFTGNQDVLFTNNPESRQYFEDCYIEGTTDFIFGSATAWFEKCRIYCKKNSHITAASTPLEKEFGYVFNRCRITGDSSLHQVSLGRPWRPGAAVTYLDTYMGSQIKAEGWSVWNTNNNHLTSRYAEYNNYGPGADPRGRVPWSRQLSSDEVKKYTPEKVLRGWDPKKERE